VAGLTPVRVHFCTIGALRPAVMQMRTYAVPFCMSFDRGGGRVQKSTRAQRQHAPLGAPR
jgi:hypothetical protein